MLTACLFPQLYKPGHYGPYDDSIDFKKADYQTQWSQAKILILESFADYLTLVRGFPGFLANQKGRPLTEQEHRRWNPYHVDEMYSEMSRFVETRKASFLLMLHSQVFIDMNFTLRGAASRGLSELRNGTMRMLTSLRERDTVESVNKPESWPSQNEEAVSQFKLEAELWVAEQDPVTSVRKFVSRHAAGAGDESRFISMLMERNPMMAGMLLFRLQLLFHEIGLALVGGWGTVLYAAHMYVAAKHSGTLPGQSPPHWPDMERILEMHRPDDVFGGRVPTNVDDSLQSFLRMMGMSIEGMQAFRRAGTGVPVPPAQLARNRLRTPSIILQERPQGTARLHSNSTHLQGQVSRQRTRSMHRDRSH